MARFPQARLVTNELLQLFQQKTYDLEFFDTDGNAFSQVRMVVPIKVKQEQGEINNTMRGTARARCGVMVAFRGSCRELKQDRHWRNKTRRMVWLLQCNEMHKMVQFIVRQALSVNRQALSQGPREKVIPILEPLFACVMNLLHRNCNRRYFQRAGLTKILTLVFVVMLNH